MLRGRLSALALALPLALVFNPVLHAQEYCLALRGNGELMPAHWGAMANLTEKMGLPVAQAGGSSASITMMLNEAVAANKFVSSASGQTQRNRAALIYKSFEGFVDYLTTTPEWRDFVTLYQRAQTSMGSQWLTELQKLLKSASEIENAKLQAYLAQNLDLFKSNYRTGVKLGLISQKNYAPLLLSLGRLSSGDFSNAEEDVARAKFYADELKEAIRVFGTFDAATDANLFFRPGIVEFARFGEQFGRMAQFYSNLSPATSSSKMTIDALWESFFSACENTQGQLWSEIQSYNRECSKSFSRLVEGGLKATDGTSFADLEAGTYIPSFPTTAVITGAGAIEVSSGMANYETRRDPKFGFTFFLSDPESVRFGYWGSSQALEKINLTLPKDRDEKSRRFLALGPATWKKILALSPAEPGLASMQKFDQDGREFVSAGGWSDLHPVLVLRAAGCSRVVYVTRRGGESPFAQGVAKRLFSTSENDPAAAEIVRKLYDLNNPKSSMRQSLDQADAVLCTDWNRFGIKSGVKDMIREAYRASPYYVRNRKAFDGIALSPQLNPRDVTADGKPVYEGCF